LLEKLSTLSRQKSAMPRQIGTETMSGKSSMKHTKNAAAPMIAESPPEYPMGDLTGWGLKVRPGEPLKSSSCLYSEQIESQTSSQFVAFQHPFWLIQRPWRNASSRTGCSEPLLARVSGTNGSKGWPVVVVRAPPASRTSTAAAATSQA